MRRSSSPEPYHYHKAPLIQETTGTENPFNGIDVGERAAPFCGTDFDGDGKIDCVVGNENGTLKYFLNSSTSSSPRFIERTGSENPFDGIHIVGSDASPFCGTDLNGDGKIDCVIGNRGGTLQYVVNTGTSSSPKFTQRWGSWNPFNGINVGQLAAPFCGTDFDGDGKIGCVVGSRDGRLRYFVNTGTSSSPTFTERIGTENPFSGVNVVSTASPFCGMDFDGDGKKDCLIGNYEGKLKHYVNTGTSSSPKFTERIGTENPFNSIDVGLRAKPFCSTDFDGNGKIGCVVGNEDGNLQYIVNTGTSSSAKFAERTGTENLFNDINVGFLSSPFCGTDFDGDGKIGCVVGDGSENLTYFVNTGTSSSPKFTERSGNENPFDGINVGERVAPFCGTDFDGDGKIGCVVGSRDGRLRYLVNTGNSSSPKFTERIGTRNPFNGIDVGNYAAPFCSTDFDGHGKIGCVVGNGAGKLQYFVNTGTSSSPTFTKRTGSENPFDGIIFGSRAKPFCGMDFDGDGKKDCVVGNMDGKLQYFVNTGNSSSLTFTERTGSENPFDSVHVGQAAAPFCGIDVDGDGDMDCVAGTTQGIKDVRNYAVESYCFYRGSFSVSEWRCLCEPGYFGRQCLETCPGVQDKRICNEKGACWTDTDKEGTCICETGYGGDGCDDCFKGKVSYFGNGTEGANLRQRCTRNPDESNLNIAHNSQTSLLLSQVRALSRKGDLFGPWPMRQRQKWEWDMCL